MLITPTFVAYADSPSIIGQVIEEAVKRVPHPPGTTPLMTWKGLTIGGRFVPILIHDTIEERDCLIADLSVLNDNVTYEVGYAIGRQKPLLLVMNREILSGLDEISRIGIFDAIGYLQYENADQLAGLMLGANTAVPLHTIEANIDRKAPVYMLEGMVKSEATTRLFSRIKKKGLKFRSFDPNETPRLAAHDVITQVARSLGVIVTRLQPSIAHDARFHNLRASFIAGLAVGMEKELLVLQTGTDINPLDYRDRVMTCQRLEQIDDAIDAFTPQITIALQNERTVETNSERPLIQSLNLGSSAAENEFSDLAQYFVETDIFRRAMRGEIRIALGRKGSGKTALFGQVRDRVRRSRQNVVLDLKPEGYKLLKFKEDIISLLQTGTFEHTVEVLWEYILHLELAYKLLEKDADNHLRDHRLYESYRRLYDLYHSDYYISEGDFSERLTKLLSEISQDLRSKYGEETSIRLSTPEITALIYKHDLQKLRAELLGYLRLKGEVWFLLDNLDKGWPTHGVKFEDLLIIRTLLEATRKMEQMLNSKGVDCRTMIFLRNDIYELLVEETSDRGKESRALVDWEDPRALKELLKRRFVYNGMSKTAEFGELWQAICVPEIDGQHTADYLLERSLMRPRGLLNCLTNCIGYAINRAHTRIEVEDIRFGLSNYSRDLARDIGLEVRDVLGEHEDILYYFLGAPSRITSDQIRLRFIDAGVDENHWDSVTNVLLWYGFLGCGRDDGSSVYIYNVGYDIRILKAMIDRQPEHSERYSINPAFWYGLEIVP